MTEDEMIAAALAAECDMRQQEPFDFAWCNTHDETFPLGGICPIHRRKLERRVALGEANADSHVRLEDLVALDLDDVVRGRS